MIMLVKDLSGGSISIKLQDESNLITNENTIIGNTVLVWSYFRKTYSLQVKLEKGLQ